MANKVFSIQIPNLEVIRLPGVEVTFFEFLLLALLASAFERLAAPVICSTKSVPTYVGGRRMRLPSSRYYLRTSLIFVNHTW